MCASTTLNETQKTQIRTWLELNIAASRHTGITGYPLGKSYIDAHTNSGAGISLRRKYVKVDRATAKLVPEASGMTAEQVRALIDA